MTAARNSAGRARRPSAIPADTEHVLPVRWREPGPPLEVDLGCHRGTFVVAMAERFPERRFLGIERQLGRVQRCQAKISRLALTNAWVVQGEGATTLREHLAPGSVDVIHVSFPDPWPKRRHWDRRLVNGEFLRLAWQALKPGGQLRLMTDDQPYFEAMERAAAACPEFRPEPWDDGRSYPETEFQRKFNALGKPVYRLALGRGNAIASS